MNFELDQEQAGKVAKWMDSHRQAYCGAIGGRYVYSFCETAVGIIVKVYDEITKETLDVSDYENW